MLLPRYYTITHKQQQSPAEWRYRVTLHEDCDVYRGHFPGNPIAPGVCTIQMIKELAADLLQREVRIAAIKQCKFLSPLRPDEQSLVEVRLSSADGQTLSADIYANEKLVMKFKSTIL